MRKSVLRSVRLDDDVWAAVKDLNVSLNQFLRGLLLDHSIIANPAILLEDAAEFDERRAETRERMANGAGRTSVQAFTTKAEGQEMTEAPFTFYEGWLTCPCGERVYVILKDSETYPCPNCKSALEFEPQT